MFQFTGHTAGLAFSPVKSLPTKIDAFSIVNMTAGAVTVNIYKTVGSSIYCIAPLNGSISANQMYESERPVVILATEQIRIEASGAINFDFALSNIKP